MIVILINHAGVPQCLLRIAPKGFDVLLEELLKTRDFRMLPMDVFEL